MYAKEKKHRKEAHYRSIAVKIEITLEGNFISLNHHITAWREGLALQGQKA